MEYIIAKILIAASADCVEILFVVYRVYLFIKYVDDFFSFDPGLAHLVDLVERP